MACIIEPKIGSDGEYIKWDPTQIISTKPFVNIVTSASEPMMTFDSMNFVKTKSLIYSPFHQEAHCYRMRYLGIVNFIKYINIA